MSLGFFVFLVVVALNIFAAAHIRKGNRGPAVYLAILAVLVFAVGVIVSYVFKFEGAPNAPMAVVLLAICLFAGIFWMRRLPSAEE